MTNPASGCSVGDSVQVTANQQIPSVTIAAPAVLSCLQSTVTLSAMAIGTLLAYQWQTGDGQFVSGATSATPVVAAPGLYALTVTDGTNGCTRTASVNVLENSIPPNVQAASVGAITCTVPTQMIAAQNLSLPDNFSYSWTAANGGNIVSGANGLTPTIDAGGDYTLTTTNESNGCTNILLVSVSQNTTLPTASAGPDGTLTCSADTLIINGAGTGANNLTFVWTASDGGHLVSGANTPLPTIDQPGAYTLLVTNPVNGCTATDSVQIGNDINAPQADAGPPVTLSCALQQTTLAATASLGANFSYQWTTTGGHLVSGTSTLLPTVDAPGLYQLAVTDSTNGCITQATVTVDEDVAPPVVDAGPPATITCASPLLPLAGTASGANNLIVQWTTANGHLVNGIAGLTPQVDQTGTYLLTATNPANGCTASDNVTISLDTLRPAISAVAPKTLTCTMLSVDLHPTVTTPLTGFTAAWTTVSGHFNGPQNALSTLADAPGNYLLTVHDLLNGCTATLQTIVLQDIVPPIALANAPSPITCDHPIVSLSGAGSSTGIYFEHLWTASNGGQIQSGPMMLAPTITTAGTYTLTVKNTANGCLTTVQTSVNQNIIPPVANAGPDAELHCQQTEVTLQGSSTTISLLTFAWSTPDGHVQNGSATALPVADQPGAYTLTVTDIDNGCTMTDTATVTGIPLPHFLPTVWPPDCFDPTGDVDFGPVTGGTAPFRYSTDGGLSFQDSPAFDNLAPGIHDLAIADQHGCSATQTIEVELPFLPTVALNSVFSLQQGDSVQLQPLLNLPVSSIASWQWTPTEGLSCTDCPQPWAKPLRTTVYTLIINDLNGCAATANTQLRVDRRRNLYAPNVFSPNGDGQNDHFTLYGKGVRELRTLRIFDRWGAELFLAEHLPIGEEADGWGGDFRNKALAPAVFVWQAVIEFLDGEVAVFSGDVTLVR